MTAKGIRSWVLCTLGLAVLMIGCRGTAKPAKVRLRWVTDPNPARKLQLALFHQAHPDIEVYVDPSAGSMTKVLIQMAAHAGPDLVDVYTNEQQRHFSRHKVFLPLTERCRHAGISPDQFWPQCRHWMTYQGEVYGLPTNAGTFVLFYNKDHFDEVGLAYPDGSWTWDDYLNAARKLTIRQGPRRRFGCFIGYYDHWLWQAGGEYFSEDGTRCAMNSPQAVRAFQFLYDLRHTWNVAPSQADLESFAQGEWGGGAINLFASGRVSMLDMGRWGVITFRQYQQEQRAAGEGVLRFGVAPLPYDATRATTFLTRATCINAETRHPDEAFAFVQFLATPEYNRLIAEGGDGFPALKALAESDLFLVDPRYPEEDQNQVYLDSVAYARAPLVSPYILPAEFQNLRDDFFDYLNVGEKGVTVAQKLQRLCAEVNAAIARYRAKEGL